MLIFPDNVTSADQTKLYAEPIDIDSGVDKFFQKGITSNVFVTAVEKLTTTEATIFNSFIKVTLDKNIGLDYSRLSLSIYRTVLGELVRWPKTKEQDDSVNTLIQEIVIAPPANGSTNIATVFMVPPSDLTQKTDGPILKVNTGDWVRITLNDKLVTNGDYMVYSVGTVENEDYYISGVGHPEGSGNNYTLKFNIQLPETYDIPRKSSWICNAFDY